MGRGKGRNKDEVINIDILRSTRDELKKEKKNFRMISKKRFKNYDDVIIHLIKYMRKRS